MTTAFTLYWRHRAPLRALAGLLLGACLLPWNAHGQAPSVTQWRLIATHNPEAQPILQVLHQQLRMHLKRPVELIFREEQPTLRLELDDQQPMVILASAHALSLDTGPADSLYHAGNLRPMQVFAEMPWCLMAHANARVWEYSSPSEWLLHTQRPIRLAMGAEGGHPTLWAQALARHLALLSATPPSFVLERFKGAQQLQQLLREGTDLALGQCAYHYRPESRTRLLAIGNPQSHFGSTPSFTDVRLPPLPKNWLAAFVPHGMDADQEHRLAQALERTAASAELQHMLLRERQTPLQLNHAQSVRYLHDYLGTWKAVAELLQRHDSPLHSP